MGERKVKNTITKILSKVRGRPMPSAPKSGLKDARYGDGGKVSRKKGS